MYALFFVVQNVKKKKKLKYQFYVLKLTGGSFPVENEAIHEYILYSV